MGNHSGHGQDAHATAERSSWLQSGMGVPPVIRENRKTRKKLIVTQTTDSSEMCADGQENRQS
ncbi:MAG TPA: hypothetical protein VFC28_02425 [Opitutaceae bacterium]|jgi:hypothetical protein|nr:hypothetical protein [Opitutaceae bacterium]